MFISISAISSNIKNRTDNCSICFCVICVICVICGSEKLRQNFIIHQFPVKALPKNLYIPEILLTKRKQINTVCFFKKSAWFLIFCWIISVTSSSPFSSSTISSCFLRIRAVLPILANHIRPIGLPYPSRKTISIDCHILNCTRIEGEGCIVIRRRPITQ